MSERHSADPVQRLRTLATDVLNGEQRSGAGRMLFEHTRAGLMAANARSTGDWSQLASRADWERFRDARVAALRRSLGEFPPAPEPPDVEVTATIAGDGFRIENLLYGSRPGAPVPANLYVPDPPIGAAAGGGMPGILLCHSHHQPKTQGELQDMGMTWARNGAMVLVPDMLGHGERRQHPFPDRPKDDSGIDWRHQDYHSRYFMGMQMHVAGECLIGWMVWDLLRGVDVLLSRPGIDPGRIIVIGAVAGGGDPVAVAAAIDPRISCAVPFNFGGPQPESHYPLPPDAEAAFNYAGIGSWESTRNLRGSARDGFLPWVIVGAAAPRPLVYAHEFSWDRDRDPVWQRLHRIYSFYGSPEKLESVHGYGVVRDRPPAASHCTNVGPLHRGQVYPALDCWFAMPIPDPEFQQRRSPEELRCLTPAVAARRPAGKVHALMADLAGRRVAAVRAELEPLEPADRRRKLRADWRRLLGEVEPAAQVKIDRRERVRTGEGPPIATQGDWGPQFLVEHAVLEVEPGAGPPVATQGDWGPLLVPVQLLLPPSAGRGGPPPVVVAVAQEGKSAFLAQRTGEVAGLVQGGVAVCLADLRGTGETAPDDGGNRGPEGPATEISSTELMLGRTLVGSRLRDLRSVMGYLRTRGEIDTGRIGLWGDSFAPTNPPDLVDPPVGPEDQPAVSEPLGGLLALLGALFEDEVAAVLARGGLVGFEALLDSPFCYVPHDVIVPGALTAGDLCDVAAALAPRPLRMEAMVDGRNIPASQADLARRLAPTRRAYADRLDRLVLSQQASDASAWLVDALTTD